LCEWSGRTMALLKARQVRACPRATQPRRGISRATARRLWVARARPGPRAGTAAHILACLAGGMLVPPPLRPPGCLSQAPRSGVSPFTSTCMRTALPRLAGSAIAAAAKGSRGAGAALSPAKVAMAMSESTRELASTERCLEARPRPMSSLARPQTQLLPAGLTRRQAQCLRAGGAEAEGSNGFALRHRLGAAPASAPPGLRVMVRSRSFAAPPRLSRNTREVFWRAGEP